jgi:hypothetical protein
MQLKYLVEFVQGFLFCFLIGLNLNNDVAIWKKIFFQ